MAALACWKNSANLFCKMSCVLDLLDCFSRGTVYMTPLSLLYLVNLSFPRKVWFILVKHGEWDSPDLGDTGYFLLCDIRRRRFLPSKASLEQLKHVPFLMCLKKHLWTWIQSCEGHLASLIFSFLARDKTNTFGTQWYLVWLGDWSQNPHWGQNPRMLKSLYVKWRSIHV